MASTSSGEAARQMSPEERRITIHSAAEFEPMRRAGRLAAETLDYITPFVTPGTTTEHLDRLCHDFIVTRGAIPAPLNYRGFPKSICTSVNHVVCHGIPNEKKRLQDGDIVNIDVTVILEGWHGDTSRMFYIGEPKVRAKLLVDTTYEAMWRGIEQVRPGATLGDVAEPACHAAIEPALEGNDVLHQADIARVLAVDNPCKCERQTAITVGTGDVVERKA
jgi:methionyl aminopeptidase